MISEIILVFIGTLDMHYFPKFTCFSSNFSSVSDDFYYSLVPNDGFLHIPSRYLLSSVLFTFISPPPGRHF